MSYLDRAGSVKAIKNISDLFCEISDVYKEHGIDINRDVGRKNILISAAQEHFFAEAIAGVVGECSNDGRTGMADIIIESLDNKEVECKVLCQGKTGAWQLQTDKATLEKKGSCDFLYLLFDRTHENTAVLLFENLIPDDFYDPAPGSRGKARLKKSTAFKKCKALVGGYSNKREQYLERYRKDISAAKTVTQKKKAEQKWSLWYNKDDSYSIQLESVNGLK
tara:strand:- start:1214 stop:1879 length:666 start_codon:yes stop_codon:yes gene_type:complete